MQRLKLYPVGHPCLLDVVRRDDDSRSLLLCDFYEKVPDTAKENKVPALAFITAGAFIAPNIEENILERNTFYKCTRARVCI